MVLEILNAFEIASIDIYSPFLIYYLYSLAIVVLLVLSALVSGAEVAFFSLNQTDLDKAKLYGNKKVKVVSQLLQKPKKLLATIVIFNNFINILIVLVFNKLGGLLFTKFNKPIFIFKGHDYGSQRFLVEVVLVTFLILLFGEVLPKVYANRNSIKFACFMALPMKGLNNLLSFISQILLWINSRIEKKLGEKKADLDVERLSQALELTSYNSTTDEEQKILEGIVTFGSIETNQIMTPRIDIFALDANTSFREVVEKVIENGFSRNLVYRDSLDDIVGILYAKDLLAHLEKEDFYWHSLLRKPLFLPENKKLDDLLSDFKALKIHLAVVVDEYGGTSGLVTLEDVIEEIVGDISSEFDDSKLSYSKIDDYNYIFEGKISLKDFYKVVDISGYDFEETKGESETLAGFILEISGNFPKKNDVISFKNFDFTIEIIDRKRIKQIKVSLKKF